MKTFRRLFQISFFVALLAATAATVSAAGQETTPAADQPTAYPADQAPAPPAGEPTPSAGDQSAYPADQAPPPPAGQPTASQPTDPPGRVARLQYMTGSVSVQPQGTGDWVESSVNRPLTNADNIWADKDSRAELNLGTGLMRISSETSLTLTNVNNDAVQVQLHQGTLNVHVRKLYGGEVYEIDTPNQAFTVTKSGDYRFDVDPAGDSTLVTVWKGEGEATGQGPAVRVHAGQQARFTSGTSLAHQINDAPPPDGFDDWCKVRDKREDNSVSARYVAPGVVGAGDLDEYGTWRDEPEYGHVWVPTAVAPDWAPYSDGSWMWEDPWGWTWVDAAPWGFAPFHYGRWVSFGGYWGWAPGPYWMRPWYAPALVAWFGGPRFGIGLGFGFGGGFGWCPLGFGEPFFPWYRGSRGYFRNVNISNTRITNLRNITNNYYNNRNGGGLYGRNGIGMPRYASRPGALTAVSRNTLERGLPVAQNAAKISPSALRNLSSSGIGRPDVSPTRASMLGRKAGQPAARPSAAAASRPTVSRMTPPANSSRPTATAASSHNTGTPAARSTATPAASRAPEGQPTSARSLPQPAGRSVPRPPQGGVRSLSQPSTGATARSGGVTPSTSPMSRSVPRPPAGSFSRPTMTARNTVPSTSSAPRSYSSPYFGRSTPSSVPRPSGRVLPAPRNYPSAQSRGSYSARSYGSSGYGGYRGYRGYSGSPSSGAYRGRSYSAPSSHSSGSYGGYHGSSGSHGSSGYHGSSGSHGSSGGGSSSHGGHSGR
jgi:hypothetical protein